MAQQELPAQWKILLLDSNEKHQAFLKEALGDFTFRSYPIHLLAVNSIQAAQDRLEFNHDIAIIICNTTSYSQVTLLKFFQYVREFLKNIESRWILILDEDNSISTKSLILEQDQDIENIFFIADLNRKQYIQTTLTLAFQHYLQYVPNAKPSQYFSEFPQQIQHQLQRNHQISTPPATPNKPPLYSPLMHILDSMSDGLLIVNKLGDIRFANTAALRLFNQPLKKLINYKLGTPILSNYPTQIGIIKAPCVLGNVEMTVSMTEWENELMYVVFLKDINKQKQVEQNLRESESKFQQLADYVQEVFLLMDPQSRELMYINPACEAIWGYSTQEFYLQPYLLVQAIYPDDRPQLMNSLLKQRQGDNTMLEYRILRRDGSIRWIRERAFPIRNEQSEVYRIASIISDITEDKLSQEKIKQQALIFQCISDGIIVFDLLGKIIDWNPGAEAMFGHTKEDILGKTIDLIYPNNHPDFVGEMFEDIYKVGLKVQEIDFLRRDQSTGICEARFIPLTEITGKLVAIVSLNRDITERKQSEQALIEAKQAADAANRIKSEFLANMSHEIRTPMNGVIGMTDLLMKTELTQEQRDWLATIAKSGESLMHIINDILDFSKIESGKLDLDPVVFNLPQEIHSIFNLLQLQAEHKNIQLIYQGDRLETAYITGDITRIRQILINLLNNALKFTHTGSVTLAVSSAPSRHTTANNQRQLHFAITDTGIGIDPKFHTTLFQPFSQLDGSVTRNYGGTGLGLAICKRLVEMMGGEIWVESQVSTGSTFHFTLEVIVHPQRFFTQESEELPQTLPQTTQSFKILLAEDNDVNRKVALLILQRLGHQTEIARNGREVIEKVKQQSFNVILMDVQMPEIDGLEATKWIRQHLDSAQQPYIIALTANAMEGDAQICLDAGMNAYLKKPIKIEALKHQLEKITL